MTAWFRRGKIRVTSLLLSVDKGGSRKECVPRYHKQQYCPREKRSEQRRVKESTSERDEAVVSQVAVEMY